MCSRSNYLNQANFYLLCRGGKARETSLRIQGARESFSQLIVERSSLNPDYGPSDPTYRKRTSGARTEKLLLGERKPTSGNNNSGENSFPALRLGSSEQSIWANCLFKSKLSVYIDSNSHHLTLYLCGR